MEKWRIAVIIQSSLIPVELQIKMDGVKFFL